MNIESAKVNVAKENQQPKTSQVQIDEVNKFADELKELKTTKIEDTKTVEKQEETLKNDQKQEANEPRVIEENSNVTKTNEADKNLVPANQVIVKTFKNKEPDKAVNDSNIKLDQEPVNNEIETNVGTTIENIINPAEELLKVTKEFVPLNSKPIVDNEESQYLNDEINQSQPDKKVLESNIEEDSQLVWDRNWAGLNLKEEKLIVLDENEIQSNVKENEIQLPSENVSELNLQEIKVPLPDEKVPKFDIREENQTVQETDIQVSNENKITEEIKPIINEQPEVKVEDKAVYEIEKPDIDEPVELKQDGQKLNQVINDLSYVVKVLNQSEEKTDIIAKDEKKPADKKDEGDELINNDFNIKENKEIMPQMSPNMNFSGDGQPFSSFMNNDGEQKAGGAKLSTSAKDLAEEAAILSTMAENVAIANKNTIVQNVSVENVQQTEEPKQKTVVREDGIKKVDTETNIVRETVVKFDTVVVNEADAEVFANLVQSGEVNVNNMAPEAAERSVHISRSLADMLARAMEDNKPVRIEFDNNISVIIKVSRDGKISADFLPSSQVAEAYLKENLPLLKQRFDEQNIKYDELNQRERREQDRDRNRKKGREDE